jgi:AraC-like DNA-binding protein
MGIDSVAEPVSGLVVRQAKARHALLGHMALVRRGGIVAPSVPESTVARSSRTDRDSETPERGVRAWICSELLDEGSPRRVHPRVQRVIEYLNRHELDRRYTSLVHLAQIAELSPSRLMHVFTASIGIPLRPFLSWLKVQRAARPLSAGHSVTEAAHLAGFADAPHLARTFRRMLGVTPGNLFDRIRITENSAANLVTTVRPAEQSRRGRRG